MSFDGADADVPPKVARAEADLKRSIDRLAQLVLSPDEATGIAAAAALCLVGRGAIGPLGAAAARARRAASRCRALNLIIALGRESPLEALATLQVGLATAASRPVRCAYARAIREVLARVGRRPEMGRAGGKEAAEGGLRSRS